MPIRASAGTARRTMLPAAAIGREGSPDRLCSNRFNRRGQWPRRPVRVHRCVHRGLGIDGREHIDQPGLSSCAVDRWCGESSCTTRRPPGGTPGMSSNPCMTYSSRRRTVQVDAAGGNPGDLSAQLRPATRSGQTDLAHVKFEVEVRVVDPVGVVKSQRRVDQSPAQHRRQRQPVGDPLQYLLERDRLP